MTGPSSITYVPTCRYSMIQMKQPKNLQWRKLQLHTQGLHYIIPIITTWYQCNHSATMYHYKNTHYNLLQPPFCNWQLIHPWSSVQRKTSPISIQILSSVLWPNCNYTINSTRNTMLFQRDVYKLLPRKT